MAIVNLHLLGASALVPHTSRDRLMAVLPNATRLGLSPETVADGSRPAVHWPVLFEKRVAGGQVLISSPKNFLGGRLTFDFGATPALDLSAINPQIAAGWLQIDPVALTTLPGDGVSGQVLISAGTASEYVVGPCAVSWHSHVFPHSVDPVIKGLRVEVNGATKIVARATPWVGGTALDLLNRTLSPGETVDLFAGNFCAEDILEWTHDADNMRVVDQDFKWVLELSTNPAVQTYLTTHGILPAPEVDGGPVEATDTVAQAFQTLFGGGGGTAGCECRCCVDRLTTF